MWSKQAADTRNKNMTSFKNKITNRKRKDSSNTATTTPSVSITETPTDNKTETKKKHQRSNKNRGRNRNTTNDLPPAQKSLDDRTNNPSGPATVDDITKLVINKNETTDVVLRNANNIDISAHKTNNNTLKRYSDSFVIENNTIINDDIKLVEKPEQTPLLTRAVSGFFIIDSNRINRRFSDIFRHGTMKLSNSTENLKMNNTNDLKKINITKNDINKPTKDALKVNEKKKPTDVITTSKKSNNIKNNKKEITIESTNSYLKRVKSKIYKSKSDVPTDEVDSKLKKCKPRKSIELSGRIPEDEVAVLTPPGLKKSLTHFDFRLNRQTSNLERISRPKTFGVTKKSSDVVDNVNNSTINNSVKPVLAKAKSSSAINLSLLRTRRNKILDQVGNNCKNVQNEFDFIAFGNSGVIFESQNNRNGASFLHGNKNANKGEVKTGQPVSRSGSDRRPDSVREENLRHQESATAADCSHNTNHDKDEATTPDSTTSLPATGNNKRRTSSNINRSESVKEQPEKRKQRRLMSGRNISDPSHNNTSGDVDHPDIRPGLSNTESGSSSNSSSTSVNGRLSESPSNSEDVMARVKSDNDSEMEEEVDPINWQELVSAEELKNLNPHEKKRQDVINELFHTEGSHVRNLRVLNDIFYSSLKNNQILKSDELTLLFPNIKEMLDIHRKFNTEMKIRRKEDPIIRRVGDMLVKMFEGETLSKAAAKFCERQQLALEFVKDRRKRDSKFDSLLLECEKRRQCRRLPLQGIMPTEMQRLSKYPLLLERLINSVEESNDEESKEELANLRQALQMSKEILNYVNEATKLAMNQARLEDIQKHLDSSSFDRVPTEQNSILSEFRYLQLPKYKLVLEGTMQLRRPNKAPVPVHVLLLEEAVVILHKESDKFLLKFFQTGSQAHPTPLAPIIRINTLLVRTNAVCKDALFLVNTSTLNSQMYDLVAEDDQKRDIWFKHFSDATETYNRREGKTKRHEPTADPDYTEIVQDLPVNATSVTAERAESVGGNNEDNNNSSSVSESSTLAANNKSDNSNGPNESDEHRDRDGLTSSPEMVAGGGIQTTRVSAEEWPLIQPSQVNIAIPPVHIAETKLTIIEQIRRKDALIKEALTEKERMVADLLNIPMEDYPHIVDMATSDTSAHKDLSDRILTINHQMHQLQLAVNDSLNLTESEAVAAKGGKYPACSSNQVSNEDNAKVPAVPTHVIRTVVTSLSSELNTLWSEMKHVEEERNRLRKELHNMRERYHEEYSLHEPVTDSNSEDLVIETAECTNAQEEESTQECEK